jgi:hypothetical protein
MSVIPNFAGNFLGTGAPVANFPALSSPFGTFIKPGGRIAAYVRSTGLQDGDDLFASSGALVSSINEGLKRCRSGLNDIVFVLPGHTETFSSSGAIWPNLVAGAQIIGCAVPGSTNCPTVNLSHTGASMALNVANCTVGGINVLSSTAAVTGAVAITAAGVTFSGNYVNFSGALAGNAPIQVTGAANADLLGNLIVADSTAAVINITGAGSTNLVIAGNLIRQTQATSGGAGINVASTAGISGWIHRNLIKSATNGTIVDLGVVVGASAAATVGVFENYVMDGGSGGSGLLSPAVGS